MYMIRYLNLNFQLLMWELCPEKMKIFTREVCADGKEATQVGSMLAELQEVLFSIIKYNFYLSLSITQKTFITFSIEPSWKKKKKKPKTMVSFTQPSFSSSHSVVNVIGVFSQYEVGSSWELLEINHVDGGCITVAFQLAQPSWRICQSSSCLYCATIN